MAPKCYSSKRRWVFLYSALCLEKLTLKFLLLFVLLPLGAWAQNLTISSTGDTGTSGTNWSITGTTLTVSGGDANIQPTVIVNALASGNLIIEAGNISVEGDVNSATANTLTFKATRNVSQGNDIDITTDGGDVIFWADSDNNNDGGIRISGGGIDSNGGEIVLAGGLGNTGVPAGFATGGISNSNIGVNIDGDTQIDAAGGNITIRGRGTDDKGVNIVSSSANQATQILTSNLGDITISGEVLVTDTAGTTTSSSDGEGIALGSGSVSNTGVLIQAVEGSITLEASGGNFIADELNTGNSSIGLNIHRSAIQTIGNGSITLTGTGPSGNADNDGVNLENGTLLATGWDGTNASGTGSITIIGTAGGGNGEGIDLEDTTDNRILSGSGGLILDGRVSNSSGTGVDILGDSTNTSIDAIGGAITIRNGLNGDEGGEGDGVVLNSTIIGSAATSITINSSSDDSEAVTLEASELGSSATETIQITGEVFNVASGDEDGIRIDSGTTSLVTSATGHVILEATGFDGGEGLDVSSSANFSISAGAGNSNNGVGIEITATSGDSGSQGAEIFSGVLETQGGDISIIGNSDGDGIFLEDTTIRTITSGNISLNGTSENSDGIESEGSSNTISAAGSGTITINGTTTTGDSSGDSGIELQDITISSDTGNVTLTGQSNSSQSVSFAETDVIVSSNSGDIAIQGDEINLDASGNALSTTGTLTIEPYNNSFSAAFELTGITISETISSLTIGKATNTAAITMTDAQTIAGPISIFGGDIALNGALTATSANLNLQASGAVTQSAALTASSLSLNGSGNFTLTNTSNNVATIAGGDNTTKLGSLSFTDASGGLTIGTVNPTGIVSTGPVLIETLVGDITLSENVTTEDTSANAIIINAGKSSAVGTTTGGDIIVTGTPTLTTGSDGITKLFSGSDANSTGLTTLVGGTGNVRNNLDETSDLSGENLTGDNAYAIYREFINTAPSDITLDNNSINQSVTGVNATVGSLSTTDADAGDSHTYTLVAGTGDTDNASFNIDGSTLRTTSALSAGSYSIRINTNDGTDDFAKEFSITVNDDVAPNPPSTPDLDAASDTCDSDNDNITTITTPSFTGTAEANTTINLISSIDGAIGSVAADGSGNWSITSSELSQGVHSIIATATDAANNTSNASSGLSVTITTPDDASFSYGASAYCVSTADPSPTITGLSGGSFSSTAGLSIDTASGLIDVSTSTPGTYTVTYTTVGSCPNSADVSVTINGLDDASFGYSGTAYCVSAADPSPTITGLSGGSFSSTAGLSINTASGLIDVSASTPGTYTVTYTTTGNCPNSSNVSVTINALDDASFSYASDTYEVSGIDPQPIITGNPGGSFASTAGLSIDGNSGLIDLSASTPGSYTVTYTTTGPCVNSSTFDVTIEDTLSTESVVFGLETISFYPSPASTNLHIHNPSQIALKQISIYDLQGKLLMDFSIEQSVSNPSINVSHLDAAVYIIKIQTQDARQKTLRFTKE